MEIHGNIYQITTGNPYNRAFLNLEQKDGYVCAWSSCFNQPTVLVREGITFYIYQFDSEEYYNEWLEQQDQSIYTITRIEPIPDKSSVL